MNTTGSSLSRSSTIPACLISLLIIAGALMIRIRLLGTPLERDEGEYAYMAQLLLKGVPPYIHAYTMKLPGVAIMYTLFMSIFGQSATGIHLGLTLVNAGCMALVYLLARRLFRRETAILAAAFYAVLSLSQTVLGISAHATQLVVLFSLAGIILVEHAMAKGQTTLVFIGGVFFGMAVLMKQHAAIIIPFALVFQLWPWGSDIKRKYPVNCALFLAGAATPCAVVALWLYHAGVFDRFWFWTVRYAGEYATGLSIAQGGREFAQKFSAIARANAPIWLLAAAGLAALCRNRTPRSEKLFLLGFLAASYAMILPGLYFREHYFILVLPPIAMLAGYAVQSAVDLSSGRLRALLPSVICMMATGYFIHAESDYLFRLPPTEVSRKLYGTNPFPEAVQIAEYIRTQTTDEDRIAILGSEPEILFLADRISATGHIYMYGLMEGHRYAGEMQSQLISEIESTAPEYIVVVNISTSWLLRPDSLNRVLEWGDAYLSLRYDEVGIVEIFPDRPSRYLWGDNTAGYQPESESYLSIFKRRW